MNPHFAEPRWLWLAVLAPLALVALQSYSAWARKKQLGRIAAPDVVQDLTRSHSPIRRALKHILLVLAVSSIGLALARQYVELHGGRLWLESGVGQGSSFHISLPITGLAAPAPEAAKLPQMAELLQK